MSSEALAWAFHQDCKSSSVKFTLVALCECANYRTGRITPSIAHLSEITGQNRKTVITNIAALEAEGKIRDTGERVGRTAQIKVYEVVYETVPQTEQFQERNSSEFAGKQSQKRDTEPSFEPSSPSEATPPSEKPARKAKQTFACPEGCDPVDWECLVKLRSDNRKPMNEGAYRQIIGKLARWAEAGWPPGPILAHAVERGWLTVFPTDEMKAAPNGLPARQADIRRAPDNRGSRPNPCLDMLYAAEAEIRAGENPEPDLGPWPPLRAIASG